MALGGVLGMLGMPLPFLELLIAGSIIVLGALIAFNVRPPLVVGMAIAAFFAVAHGHGHGSEMPESISGLTYGLGFVLATILLHVAGIALGNGTVRFMRPAILRSAGAAASAVWFALALAH
jgi:urease accessory protein